jgi:hypothetical protein
MTVAATPRRNRVIGDALVAIFVLILILKKAAKTEDEHENDKLDFDFLDTLLQSKTCVMATRAHLATGRRRHAAERFLLKFFRPQPINA